MLDARFLIDVHFRQGGKHKESFPPQAEAAGNIPPPVQPHRTGGYISQTDEWHIEEERLGAADDFTPPPPPPPPPPQTPPSKPEPKKQ